MRVLLTGHQGYLGTVMSPILATAGHDVAGLDSGLFADCVLGPLDVPDVPGLAVDIRDVHPASCGASMPSSTLQRCRTIPLARSHPRSPMTSTITPRQGSPG